MNLQSLWTAKVPDLKRKKQGENDNIISKEHISL